LNHPTFVKPPYLLVANACIQNLKLNAFLT
jgi:hypothetical protein